MFTTGPVTSSWPAGPTPVAASPDSMPILTSRGAARPSERPRRRTRSRIAIPARTARIASSSWTWGRPNTAMTASPMNFSGRPRKACSSSVAASKNRPITSRARSGSRDWARPVESTRSANRTVTILRSWVPRSMPTTAPQLEQNLALAWRGWPHTAPTLPTRPCRLTSCSTPTSKARAAVERITAKSIGRRAENCGEQRVAGLDGVWELGVAHDHRPRWQSRDHRRRRRPAIQHPDLAEEIAGVQGRPGFAVHLHARPALEQKVEAVGGSALLDEGVIRFQVHLVGAAGQELELLAAAPGEQRNAADCVHFRVAHGGRIPPRRRSVNRKLK